jgi:transposase
MFVIFIFVLETQTKMRSARKIVLNTEDRTELERRNRSQTIEKRLSERARIILLASDGMESKEIARKLGVRQATVSKWRGRFLQYGIPGLQDEQRPGKPATYKKEDERRILELLDKKPPRGYSSWNGSLIAERLKDIGKDHIWKVLRKYGIQLQRKHSWCISTDPEFAQKSADIIGL